MTSNPQKKKDPKINEFSKAGQNMLNIQKSMLAIKPGKLNLKNITIYNSIKKMEEI